MSIKITLPPPVGPAQHEILKHFLDPKINFIVVVCGRR